MRTARFAAYALALAFAVTGCADPYEGRCAVSGKVTLKGQPFSKDGSISFEPLDGQGTRGGVAVKGGTYAIPRDGGLKPGKYLVRLTAGDGKTPAAETEAGGPGGNTNIVSMDLIPPDFGLASKQTITVTADGPNAFNFDIPALNEAKPRKR